MTKFAKDPSRFLPALLLLFAGSGCAALIYEIVWYQLLQLVIGSSAISLGVLLATFMGGLCAGSLALPRLGWAREGHPLRLYARSNSASAPCGVLVLFGMPLLDGVYMAAVGHGMPAILLRALVCALCLMPPTFLMGASLPAAARWIESTPQGVAWMGMLYGGNTAGAVFGCLLAGFYLLRQFDMSTATFVAAVLNVLVGLGALWVAGRKPERAKGAPAEIGGLAGQSEASVDGPAACPDLSRNRHIGRLRAGRGSGLDAAAGADAGSHRLHVFHHPGGVSDRHRDGERGGIGDGAGVPRRRGGATGVRRVPATVGRGYRVDGLHDCRFPALLAGESAAFHQPVVYVPDRPGAGAVDHSAGGHAVGRQFSAGPGRGGHPERRCRAPGGGNLRGQYRRSHCGRAQLQPGADAVDRDAEAASGC